MHKFMKANYAFYEPSECVVWETVYKGRICCIFCTHMAADWSALSSDVLCNHYETGKISHSMDTHGVFPSSPGLNPLSLNEEWHCWDPLPILYSLKNDARPEKL